MDVKDLRTDSSLGERNNDGSKYSQGGGALPCNRNKSYQDIGSNPLAKTEPTLVRPCAVIGPDRVVPPPASNDAFLKKASIDPWLNPDNLYRRPPDYPFKATINQNPSRNISPRQTFQENMQRIMVPPNYNAVKHSDDVNPNLNQDRNVAISKNVKPNMAPEAKYCDVPYTINSLPNEPKNIREGEMYVSNVNSPLNPTANPWPPGSVNMHAPRTFGAHEMYQYSQYQNCAGPRPTIIPVNRPTRTIQEEPGFPYPEHYYQDPSIRFKPYPPVKERYTQPRYDYIGNYPPIGTYHVPSPLQTHKYDIPKSAQPHPYSIHPYPQLKYVDNRIHDHTMDGYQRAPNQPHFNIPFRNQVIHPPYAPVVGKMHPYPPDAHTTLPHGKVDQCNKMPFNNSNKMYMEYDNSRTKAYPMSDGYFVNEMSRVRPVKNPIMLPNYSCITMPTTPTHQQYRKDSNLQMRPFEYVQYRNLDPSVNNNMMMRHQPQFSPSTLAISPTDSIASNDTAQTHGTSQEDYGYVSQSSSASVRSIDSGIYKPHNEYYKQYNYRYSPIVGSSPTLSKSDSNSSDNKIKQINVRQFFQMWNEGEDDNLEGTLPKDSVVQNSSSEVKNIQQQKQLTSNQDQLYVLGLVNVPSEELSKYEHIQKISKLPENIKGYNNLELLNQFEEAIESTNTNGRKANSKEYPMPLKENTSKHLVEALPRPVSPLDVEAKISQSVIHKEVGCNFEIRPCSPKMLNVEVAAPAQNILGERIIEKVTNPLSKLIKSPRPISTDDDAKCNLKRQEKSFSITDNPSCKMIGSPYSTNSNLDSMKSNYSLQELEINSGVCLASLPQLDNEIELNFPEVNQQFINANKKECSPNNTHLRSKIEEDSSLNTSSVDSDIIKHEKTSAQNESGKSFTKLIKYRKTKSMPLSCPDNVEHAKAVRTDSVIIKNPENIKNIEDKFLNSSFNVPMNLSSQSPINEKSDSELPNNLNNTRNENTMALDFSLSKSSNDLPIIVVEKDDHIKSSTYNTKNTSFDNVSKASNQKNNNINSKVLEEKAVNDILLDESNQVKKPDVKEVSDGDATNSDNSETFSSLLDNVYAQNLTSDYSRLEHIDRIDKSNIDIINRDADIEILDPVQKTAENEKFREDNSIAPNDDTERNKFDARLFIRSAENESNFVDSTDKISSNILSPQNKEADYPNQNLIENDEISASLEKMFEDCRDNMKSYESRSEEAVVSLPKQINKYYCVRNKELYSPWIQKLLLNTEGLCSLNKAIPNEVLNKHIVHDVEIYEDCRLPLDQKENDLQGINLEESMENNDADLTLNKALEEEVPEVFVLSPCQSSLNNNDDQHCENIDNMDTQHSENHENCLFLKNESEETPDSNVKSEEKLMNLNPNNLLINTDHLNANEFEYKKHHERYLVNEIDTIHNSVAKEQKESENMLNICTVETSLKVENKSENLLETTVLTVEENNFAIVNTDSEINKINEASQVISSQLLTCSTLNEKLFTDDLQSHKDQNVGTLTDNADVDIHIVKSFHSTCNLDQKNSCVSKNVSDNMIYSEETNIPNIVISDHSTGEISELNREKHDTQVDIAEVNNEIVQNDYVHRLDENTSPDEDTALTNYASIDKRDNTVTHEQLQSDIFQSSTNQGKFIEQLQEDISERKRRPLKRSFSDSELSSCRKVDQCTENAQILWSSKRQKIYELENTDQNGIAEKLCHIINNNRRNSVSAFYNEEDVSFCILIDDNCVMTDEVESDKICFAELEEDCVTAINVINDINESEQPVNAANEDQAENVRFEEGGFDSPRNELNFSEDVMLNYESEKSNPVDWLDNVACVETVISDDIVEEAICSNNSSPKDTNDTNFGVSEICNDEFNDSIIEEHILENVCEHEPYKTPPMEYDDNLSSYELENFEANNILYRDECLEKILSESNGRDLTQSSTHDLEVNFMSDDTSTAVPEDKENIFVDNISLHNDKSRVEVCNENESDVDECLNTAKSSCIMRDVMQSCESSTDNVFSFKQTDDDFSYATSSSPEVSSTTSEEKSSTSILLKITNYNGSRISEVNEISPNQPRCKFTEKKDYSNGGLSKRPLLTKAAQKYIPPLKESIRDLKVQLSLPQQKLLKLKQLKLSKNEPKIIKNNISTIHKKPKPNFEDVLKSIDEVQIKMHKEKSKKPKAVPKVVIKKSQNGSHYTSSTKRETFNPDLTGRKWQPWVFLEKNHFIDKMVMKNKTKAIFSHRQNTYVLAENFKKYKAISSAKFVITHPNSGDTSKGQLKYTIRLKHTY